MEKSIRFLQFNLENFFLHLDKTPTNLNLTEEEWQGLTYSTVRLKSLRKIKDIARMIMEQDPDVAVLCEVGGRESLDNFNQLFLKDTYNVHLIEGNSQRGIDIGYLVKEGFPFKVLLITHKQRPIHFLYQHEIGTNKKTNYFSRDVAELRIFKENSNSPSLIILGVHLKSKLDLDRIDTDGKMRRAAEVRALVSIYEEILTETKGLIPILVSGDFNGKAAKSNYESEFNPIFQQTELMDILDLLNKPDKERFTQIVFNSMGQAVETQIDYTFIDLKWKHLLLGAEVVRYRDERGHILPIPNSFEQRSSFPSDHYPTRFDLLIKK